MTFTARLRAPGQSVFLNMSRAFGDSSAFDESSGIERVRTYWNRRPCNLRRSLQAGRDPPVFRPKHAELSRQTAFPGFAEHRRWGPASACWRSAAAWSTDTVGASRRAGAMVTAVDLSSRSLDLARQRVDVFRRRRPRTVHRGGCRAVVWNSSSRRLRSGLRLHGVIHHTPAPSGCWARTGISAARTPR